MKSTRDVLLQTEKMEAAAQFYEHILGFKVFERSDQLIGLETGSFRFFLDKGKPLGPVFEFTVPNVEAAKRKLVEAGCAVEAEDPKVPRCYIRDPFGLIFNLAQQSH